MNYSMDVIRKNEFITSEWSGGTTTQLMIYPPNCLYSERNFKWRLSSAKVDVEESTFTNLPGISRIIMVIEGELKLEHKGHHKAHLKPFQQDSFMGSYETKSLGKVTDFNLMMGKGCNGILEYISLNKGESKNTTLKGIKGKDYAEITDAFYCVDGEIEIKTDYNEIIHINEGDLICVSRGVKENPINFEIDNKYIKEVKIIKATVYY